MLKPFATVLADRSRGLRLESNSLIFLNSVIHIQLRHFLPELQGADTWFLASEDKMAD